MRYAATEQVVTRWSEYGQYLRRWFHAPDLGALEVVFCAYTSHFADGDKPVWLFVNGDSGSGKTEIVYYGLLGCHLVDGVGDLSAKTFLSGFGHGAAQYSLLNRIGGGTGSGVLAFKDFTTILSKRDEQRKEIISQLREIHDGSFSREVGAAGKTIYWRGKVTCLAMVTPAIDDYWAVTRELGDRFFTVRWGRGCPTQTGRAAFAQVGNSEAIRSEIQERTKRILDGAEKRQAAPPRAADMEPAIALCSIATQLRTNVKRDPYRRNEILDKKATESPTRFVMAVAQLARARAALYGREQADGRDIQAVKRIVLESVPLRRWEIMNAVPDGPGTTWSTLASALGMSEGSVQYVLDELEAIGVIQRFAQGSNTHIRFRHEFQALKNAASELM